MTCTQQREIRIAVQSESRLLRDALSGALGTWPEFTMIGQTATIEGLHTVCASHQPDFLVVDGGTLRIEAINRLGLLHIRFPATELVVVYDAMSRTTLDAAVNAGVSALTPYSGGLDRLMRILHARAQRLRGSRRVPRSLTERELAIVSLLGSGRTAPEIADVLGISPYTVENHKRHIYTKLGIGNQSQAVSRAISLGLLGGPADATTPDSTDDPATGHDPGAGEELILVHGSTGPCLERVVLALASAGLQFVLTAGDEAPGRHRHADPRRPTTAVLIDPTDETWFVPCSLGAPAVVVYTTMPKPNDAVDALLRGARSLLLARDVPTEICRVISLINRGYLVMTSSYAGELIRWASAGTSGPAPGPLRLTARERDILRSIADGDTVRQTARLLGIAAKTVENTQARLFRKLGTRNRSETLLKAYQLGLIAPNALPAGEPPSDQLPANGRSADGLLVPARVAITGGTAGPGDLAPNAMR